MQQIKRVKQPWLTLLAGIFLSVGAGEVHALTLQVANNGLDSFGCGDRNTPCRSVSQAIANANAKDTIVVGPGRYGDLNGNGTFGETGEEVAEVDFGCFCMINVNKEVTLISRDGAIVTVLDAGGVPVLAANITTSGVVFGKSGQGFLLTGAGGGFNGLGMFDTDEFGHPIGDVTMAGNVASGNGGAGFGVSGNGTVVKDNRAIDNGNAGFALFGSGNVVSGNVASANGEYGFAIGGTELTLSRNAALGNEGFGIQVAAGGSATITRNNIYGNNDTNCGLFNNSGGQITATNNFWGAASGPGPDPADDVCDVEDSTTIVDPFAANEFQVR